jgi:hypothetical protein
MTIPTPLTHDQMVAIITAGGSVTFGAAVLTRVQDVPTDAEIAAHYVQDEKARYLTENVADTLYAPIGGGGGGGGISSISVYDTGPGAVQVDATTIRFPTGSLANTGDGEVVVQFPAAPDPGTANPMTAAGDMIVGGAPSNVALGTLGATAHVIDTFVGSAALLIDGDDSTFWGANFNPVAGAWAWVDLRASFLVGSARIKQHGPLNGNTFASAWKVQTSPDFTTWTDVPGGTQAIASLDDTLPFTPVNARYWRILATAGGAYNWEICTIALYLGVPGTPIALHVGADNTVLKVDPTTHLPAWATQPAAGMVNPMSSTGDLIYQPPSNVNVALSSLGATISGTSGSGLANVMDGNESSYGALPADLNGYVTIDLQAPVLIGKVHMHVTDLGGWGLSHWKVAYSTDNATYVDVLDRTMLAANETLDLPAAVTARYWRFYNMVGHGWECETIGLLTAVGAPARLPAGADNSTLMIDPTTHLPTWVPQAAGVADSGADATTTATLNALLAALRAAKVIAP